MYRIIGIILLLLSLFGCGYRLPHEAVSSDLAGKSVRVAIFGNRTFRPNLEAVVTNRIIDEFAQHPGLRVVSGDADLVLNGEVISYSNVPVSYSAADIVREYRAGVTVEATLRRSDSQKIVWKGNVSATQTYPANLTIAFQQNSEEAAVQELARVLAQKLYVEISEDF